MKDSPNNGASQRPKGLPPDHVIFGVSAPMQAVRSVVDKLVDTNVPVLILGENGTGKGLLASYIHWKSKFCPGGFAKVNCAAIPGALLESELFGYEKGAFTGAVTSKPGYVELADRGTLFLDEIGELDSRLQAKILHLLQDGRFSRIGDKEERQVNLRTVCASNRDLSKEIAAGRFRQDLYYRINVITIHLPNLCERREDIPLLADYFLAQLNARFERSAPPLGDLAVEDLKNREWRGNIRELENLIARYAILGSLDTEPTKTAARSPLLGRIEISADGTIPLKRIAKQAIREMESNLILKVLREHKWNRRKAAEALNISYRALIYKIQEAGLSVKNGRRETQLDRSPDQA
ncbi:MAG TPA: sigma-54 dependent transcriptional regulator [Candidatus Acidoferrum sp.]|nr:sigma-54 dependent transcriptional regulator [Candidatus Acidoferrum sp.]